jgi:hypothetical protein
MIASDPRVERAQAYLDDHSQDTAWLKPSELASEVQELRTHLAAVLTVIAALAAERLSAHRPMCTDDINPDTGECFGAEPTDPASAA